MKRKISLLLGGFLVIKSVICSTIQDKLSTFSIEPYEEKEFIADFNKFKIGDTIPKKYRTSEYVIKQWKLRNLPKPRYGTCWIYIDNHYILMNHKGKICKVYNRDFVYND